MDNVNVNDEYIIVAFPKTKTHITRSFTLEGEFFVTVLKYIQQRPSKVTTNKFFLAYRKSSCNNQPIGINTISAMPKTIAVWLGLENPEIYTGHTFWRSSATLFANSKLIKIYWTNRFEILNSNSSHNSTGVPGSFFVFSHNYQFYNNKLADFFSENWFFGFQVLRKIEKSKIKILPGLTRETSPLTNAYWFCCHSLNFQYFAMKIHESIVQMLHYYMEIG